jgi:predicted Fe-S protein YdhL (DUF1289 family)
MTWVFLTDAERNKIAYESGPYIVDGYEPHEAAVRQRNPRDNWQGLTKEERKAINDSLPKPMYMKHLFAAIEAKLKERNP